MEGLELLKKRLAVPKDIVILSHRNPDGDAVGSSLGLYWYLQKHGHQIHIILPSNYPEVFEWMPGVRNILIFDDDTERCTKVIEKAELIFCLDFNSLERIDKAGEVVMPLKTPVAVIDHHLNPDPFADFLLSDTTASSTCELIYRFIHLLEDQKELDKTIADCLYTGIITDTGSFKHNTTPRLFRIVAELLELGVNDYLIQDLIFNSMQEKHLRLLGHCLYNRMEILDEFKTGIITLTKADYERFDIQRGDTEGIVNYLLKMENVHVAAFITEQPTIVKLSLRSKGDFSVEEIAKAHFKGGGHKNASGGFAFQPLPAIVRKFKSLLPTYKDAILLSHSNMQLHDAHF